MSEDAEDGRRENCEAGVSVGEAESGGVGGMLGALGSTSRATASRRRLFVRWLRQWRRIFEFTLNLLWQPANGHWKGFAPV